MLSFALKIAKNLEEATKNLRDNPVYMHHYVYLLVASRQDTDEYVVRIVQQVKCVYLFEDIDDATHFASESEGALGISVRVMLTPVSDLAFKWAVYQPRGSRFLLMPLSFAASDRRDKE
ncbi:MAG: hypothetical protein SFU56_08165 [Capsulimonadales bacterium]|nr:hypothetical protein [Capsulimonadales bacterium]